jgi:hypothetical protein
MGGKNKEAAKATEAAVAQQPTSAPLQFSAFMPGQQEAIASQLSAGYGAPVSENMGMLSGLNRDVSMPLIQNSTDMAGLLASLPKDIRERIGPSGAVKPADQKSADPHMGGFSPGTPHFRTTTYKG